MSDGTPQPPSTLVDFSTINEAGAKNPIRVKFMVGFNSGVRSIRQGKLVLEGISRAERSTPYLAGYDAGRIFGRTVQTTAEITTKLEEAWRTYVSTHTGTDLGHRDLGLLPVQQVA